MKQTEGIVIAMKKPTLKRGGYLTEKYHLAGVWQKKFGVQLNVLVLVMTRLKDGQQRQAVLFSSDLSLAWEKLEEYYRLRFQIEEVHREAKQVTGLESCQCRLARIQRNHIACCFLVWYRLKDLAYKTGRTLYQIK